MAIGVLIVTESKNDRDRLADLVSSLGHWPICPSSPEELREAPPADAAVLDLDNFASSGWIEGIVRSKARHERMQVLALGARSLGESDGPARDLRVRTAIPKPLDKAYLGEVLSNIARSVRRREVGEAISRAQEEIHTFDKIVSEDESFMEVIRTARRVAASDATSVLILGESGTGKELIARAIHSDSRRKGGPFVEVNCAAIPSELLESELFGHEKGAFTDASRQKIGLFQMADGGTIFLDEIGEMSGYLQAKLLKFLDSKKLRRVSGRETIDVDARIAAATNRDLFSLTRQGRFRQDLYYRLNVVQLNVPPLRKRRGDIALLAEYFADRFAVKFNKGPVAISAQVFRLLESYQWPGNVRELQNVMERAVLLDTKGMIEPRDIPIADGTRDSEFDLELLTELRLTIPPEGIALSLVERKLVQAALESSDGNVTEAARLLRVGRGKLRTLIKRYGINVSERGADGGKTSEWLVGAAEHNYLSDSD